jgi:hypothetical protein
LRSLMKSLSTSEPDMKTWLRFGWLGRELFRIIG